MGVRGSLQGQDYIAKGYLGWTMTGTVVHARWYDSTVAGQWRIGRDNFLVDGLPSLRQKRGVASSLKERAGT